MAVKEIERKYIVDREKFENWFNENFEKVSCCQFLQQSYLAKDPVEVRLRMSKAVSSLPYCYEYGQNSEKDAFDFELTFKNGSGLVRDEINLYLQENQSKLLELTKLSENKIRKYRFVFHNVVLDEWIEQCCQIAGPAYSYNTFPTFEVDLYMDHLSFLATAEIEFCGNNAEEAAKSFEWKNKPDWILKEVTGDKTFSNANLTKYTELSKVNLIDYIQYLVGNQS